MSEEARILVASAAEKGLRKLSLSGLGLYQLPRDIECLESLQYLDISFNNLKEIPDSIGKLKELRTLFAHFNKIEKVSPLIANLECLERFYLHMNQLEIFPRPVFELKKLRAAEKINRPESGFGSFR